VANASRNGENYCTDAHPFTPVFPFALHACAFFGRSRAAVVAG